MARPAPGELEDVRPSRCHAACAAVELDPPLGFDPARLEAWPAVEGRLQWVEGRLLYAAARGDPQGGVCRLATDRVPPRRHPWLGRTPLAAPPRHAPYP